MAEEKVHRETLGQTPCGRDLMRVVATRRPHLVTCKSCVKIQNTPGAIVTIYLD